MGQISGPTERNELEYSTGWIGEDERLFTGEPNPGARGTHDRRANAASQRARLDQRVISTGCAFGTARRTLPVLPA
jgi:hypothetical protein